MNIANLINNRRCGFTRFVTIKIIILLLLFVSIPISSFSEEEFYWSDVPFEEGQTIHEARSILIKNGWNPVNQHSDETPEEYSYLNTFIKAGVVEVVDCAGTGVAPCIFFYKKGEKCITVYTSGEENPEAGYYARINSFSFDCSQRPSKNGPVRLIKGVVDSSGQIRHVKLKLLPDWTWSISVFTSENKELKVLGPKFTFRTAIYNLKTINKNKELRFVFFEAEDFKWKVVYYWDVEKDNLYYRLKNKKNNRSKLSKNLNVSNMKTKFIKSDLKEH